MKYPVRRFKSLEVALKEMEPFVRDGAHLQTGKRFKQLGDMRSREILANWLVCVTINGGTGETWATEHVMVPSHAAGKDDDAKSLILKAIEQKRTKGGAAYAEGKTLVVFLDAGAGEWHPNKVARALPDPLLFATVWVVGLQGVQDGEYVYGVTLLDLNTGNAPTFLVRISKTFDAWEVTSLQ